MTNQNDTVEEAVKKTLRSLDDVYKFVDDYPHAQAQQEAREKILTEKLTEVYQAGRNDAVDDIDHELTSYDAMLYKDTLEKARHG